MMAPILAPITTDNVPTKTPAPRPLSAIPKTKPAPNVNILPGINNTVATIYTAVIIVLSLFGG